MPSTHIVVDLGFGDAGKGTIVDALARRCSSPPLVVRHNGGAQAGHNVHLADGRHHTFSQFGSATFVPGSRTLLSHNFVFHPAGLMTEHEHLVSVGVKDALARLMVDERALVITPYQQAMNWLRELERGDKRHGTCGLGVGETVADSLDAPEDVVRVGDLLDWDTLIQKLALIRGRKLSQVTASMPRDEHLALLQNSDSIKRTADLLTTIGRQLHIVRPLQVDHLIRETPDVIFEGAQGVLLDEWYGFHPHTTWSTTTLQRAEEMLAEAGRVDFVTKIGVVRAYATRHGQGPFPTESANLTQLLREVTNTDDGPQGCFRSGWFDTVLARYAIAACPGLTSLAVTCLDRFASVEKPLMCVAYEADEQRIETLLAKPGDLDHQERLGRAIGRMVPLLAKAPRDPNEYTQLLSERLALPVSIQSHGPAAEDKRWL
jgi:adenylosuccinate synthase